MFIGQIDVAQACIFWTIVASDAIEISLYDSIHPGADDRAIRFAGSYEVA
jgi:hypothetical protein